MLRLKNIFTLDKRPRKGLLALEWVILGYAVITLLVVLFCFTKLENPEAMIWGRVRLAAITLGLWAVYRLMPCRVSDFISFGVKLILL